MNVFEKVKACFGGKQRQIASLEVENKRLDRAVFDVSQENERLKAEHEKITKDNSNLIKERDALKEDCSDACERLKTVELERHDLAMQPKEISELVDEADTTKAKPSPTDPPKPKSKNVSLDPPNRQAKKKK